MPVSFQTKAEAAIEQALNTLVIKTLSQIPLPRVRAEALLQLGRKVRHEKQPHAGR